MGAETAPRRRSLPPQAADVAAQQRRGTAVHIASDLSAADDIEQALEIAVLGFETLFGASVALRLTGTGLDTVVTASGPVDLVALPPAVRAALGDGGHDGAAPQPLGNEPRDGVLMTAADPHDVTCRLWAQFPIARPVHPDELTVGELLAHTLDLAVERVLAAEEFADREANLRRAIESHRLVGQAIGILVERHHITPAESFDRLREASQTRNLKLRDLAARVIETGLEPLDA